MTNKEISTDIVRLPEISVNIPKANDLIDTWSRFHIKQPIEARYEGETNFIWYKYNIFTRWIPDPNRSIFLIFDPLPSIRRQFLVPMLDSVPLYDLDDHFFIYTIIAAEVARLQDDAVWTIRGLIWTIENERTKSTVPNPDYPHLHDVSRFAIHTCETIDMAIQSIDNIISHHNSTMTQRPSFDNKINVLQKRIQNRLESHKIILIGLQSRSSSNKERIMNEIQLAFNSVAQFESRISVEIGRAAQIDSAAMKIVAFVTLVFFPATFVSGLFGMSFFEYDADGDNWSMSSEIWIFWLISFIVTAVTALCCAFWHKLFPPPQIGARKYESMLDEKK